MILDNFLLKLPYSYRSMKRPKTEIVFLIMDSDIAGRNSDNGIKWQANVMFTRELYTLKCLSSSVLNY